MPRSNAGDDQGRAAARSPPGGADTTEIDKARRSADGLGNFINLIVTHLTENGVMEPDRLYESPFGEITPHGPESLFPSGDVDRMITILRAARDNAAPESQAAWPASIKARSGGVR
ncbi:hypothetical protein ACK8GE_21085 [Micromonosporaceae bacterium DT194]|uniref:hypothetical protein n=1 Tax=Melissospora conviva TaxID=3388432 RepID=UPI003C19F4CF